MPAVAHPVLSTDALTVRYRLADRDLVAADGVSFSVGRGETLALVGESGSGKSSIALSIPRLLPASARVSGQVVVDGADIYSLAEKHLREVRRRKVSYIFQDPVGSLLPTATIGRQLTAAISYRMELSQKRAVDRGREMLRQVGLDDVEGVWAMYPFQLSGGMCQRVMIALALSVEPALVIADEAVSALDAITQARVLQLLRNLQDAHGFGMIFVTHDLRVAARIATHVGVMRSGLLVELKPADVLFSKGAELPYSRELITAARQLSL